MFVLRGTVVTMGTDGAVLPGGAVYVGDDGLIAAITPVDAVPDGFGSTPRAVAAGRGFIAHYGWSSSAGRRGTACPRC
ncbi:hypothetical protein JOF29_007733 [Kribbella aluminosa]|uniref:Uncharacterized protein n=1 Tax=Kribbella aluminosa TaxID=416017 RepID=A0ABS4UY96_9ACTN|nr:hypothetical protein [Kribbella aluminosa]MBP2356623.1 hypothetical protein [Kribbella aluminosa]